MKSKTNQYQFPLFLLGLVGSMALVLTAFNWEFEPDTYYGCGCCGYIEDEWIVIPYLEQKSTPKILYPVYKAISNDEEVKNIDAKLIAQIQLEWLEEMSIPEVLPEPIIEEIEEGDILLDPDTIETEGDDSKAAMFISWPNARPKGGMKAFYKYVEDNIILPKRTDSLEVKGKIFIQFTVNRDSSISDVKIIRGLKPEYDSAALRVMQNSPKWIPAKRRGRIVEQMMTLPIMINIEGYYTHEKQNK